MGRVSCGHCRGEALIGYHNFWGPVSFLEDLLLGERLGDVLLVRDCEPH